MSNRMNRRSFLSWAGVATSAPYLVRGLFSNPERSREQRRPRALRKGDTLGLVSPAGRVYDDHVYRDMEQALTEMGFRYRYGRHAKNAYGYLAGTDEERAEDLNRFFSDPGIDGILCIRGGWGCNRILPHIDFTSISRNPKFFGGFSDITALHLSIFSQTGLTTFHGPNGTSDWTPFTRRNFQRMAMGIETTGPLPPENYNMPSMQTLTSGVAEGRLIGGNLSLVCSLVGTPYLPDLSGAILFVEEIGEDVYRVDRMLSQLALSGQLERLSGFVFGTCTDCRPTGRASLSLQQVLLDYFSEYHYPACFGLPFGHVSDNMTFPVGVMARLNADKGYITIEESVFSDQSRETEGESS
ncbi:MAG: S66 peptidase family protein [Bacteroidota bacterium]